MNEIWKDIEGYEGYYQVSSHGKVRSMEREVPDPRIKSGVKKVSSRVMKPGVHNRGYLKVSLRKGGAKQMLYIHRLVGSAFLERDEHRTTINHLDGDKTNNHVSNLEWLSHLDNVRHARETGLAPTRPRAKITKLDVLWIREWLSQGFKQQAIAEAFGLDARSISAINVGRTWGDVENVQV